MQKRPFKVSAKARLWPMCISHVVWNFLAKGTWVVTCQEDNPGKEVQEVHSPYRSGVTAGVSDASHFESCDSCRTELETVAGEGGSCVSVLADAVDFQVSRGLPSHASGFLLLRSCL